MSNIKTENPKWANNKKNIILAIAVLLVISVPIFARLFWEVHEAREAFGAFNQALITRDYHKAYDLTTSALKANVSYEAFVKVQSVLTDRVGALKNFDNIDTEVREDQNGHFATIRTRLIFERGQLPFIFSLKKENNQWLIYSFNEQ